MAATSIRRPSEQQSLDTFYDNAIAKVSQGKKNNCKDILRTPGYP